VADENAGSPFVFGGARLRFSQFPRCDGAPQKKTKGRGGVLSLSINSQLLAELPKRNGTYVRKVCAPTQRKLRSAQRTNCSFQSKTHPNIVSLGHRPLPVLLPGRVRCRDLGRRGASVVFVWRRGWRFGCGRSRGSLRRRMFAFTILSHQVAFSRRSRQR
jgi:hypothetical protein